MNVCVFNKRTRPFDPPPTSFTVKIDLIEGRSYDKNA